jgi:hypothetical protein
MSKDRPRILVDQREKTPWEFKDWESDVRTMPTGDYTLEGFEKVVSVERKGGVAEFAQNLYQDRFERELARLDEVRHPFCVLEFSMEDLLSYPKGSGIPYSRYKYLRSTGPSLLRRLNQYQLRFRARFVFAGAQGKAFVVSLFKRVLECTV